MKLIQNFPEGDVLFEHCARYGFEGIVAKRVDRPYVSGPSKAWVKIKSPRLQAPDNSERFRMLEGPEAPSPLADPVTGQKAHPAQEAAMTTMCRVKG